MRISDWSSDVCSSDLYDTGLKAEKLMELDEVLAAAKQAKDAGAGRFCMGAAWRSPKDRDLDRIVPMIEGVKRSEERRVGTECVSTCRSGGSPSPENIKH